MQLRSLGLASDLALIDGDILERNDYWVVRSPEEPDYYWGNLLVFPGPPRSEDQAHWESIFEREFADLPGVGHRTFTWDVGGLSANLEAFRESGYNHEKTVVLTAGRVTPPPRPNAAIEIRELHTDSEWDDAAALQVASRDPEHGEESYRRFIMGRMEKLRARVELGLGEWFGAYLDGRQVGNLGVIRTGGGSARFQLVGTHPRWRRQGVCGTLVHGVAERTLSHPNVEQLVMLADREYHAARIYESIGFASTETLEGVCRWPSEEGP